MLTRTVGDCRNGPRCFGGIGECGKQQGTPQGHFASCGIAWSLIFAREESHGCLACVGQFVEARFAVHLALVLVRVARHNQLPA